MKKSIGFVLLVAITPCVASSGEPHKRFFVHARTPEALPHVEASPSVETSLRDTPFAFVFRESSGSNTVALGLSSLFSRDDVDVEDEWAAYDEAASTTKADVPCDKITNPHLLFERVYQATHTADGKVGGSMSAYDAGKQYERVLYTNVKSAWRLVLRLGYGQHKAKPGGGDIYVGCPGAQRVIRRYTMINAIFGQLFREHLAQVKAESADSRKK